MSVAGLVLSAGASSRMGRPKALLPIAGTLFLHRILDTLASACVTPVAVVLGSGADNIRQQARLEGVDVVINRQWELGQLSSLQAGLKHLALQHHTAVLACLVDHPVFSPNLVSSLIDTFLASGAPIVIPSHNHRRGHPVIFSAAVFSELLDTPPERGARAVVEAHAGDICYVETDEEGILWDIDTPEKYEEAIRRFSLNND